MCMLKYLCWFLVIVIFPVTADTLTPHLGKPASQEILTQWGTDIFADGEGLPEGQGTGLQGKDSYKQFCQSCHGVEGKGGSADELAGAAHGLTDNPPDKTIGTYWPYATTVFDFIRRAMPLDRPGILTDDQVYAITAYLLYLNKLLPLETVLSAKNLSTLEMPNRKGFINPYENAT